MSSIKPSADTWTAVLAESNDSARAVAVADLLTTDTKIKLYDSGGSLLRTITTAAWSKGSQSGNAYPITPGAFTDPGTGTGTPALAVFTDSSDAEIFRTDAGVNSGTFQIPSALEASVTLTAGSFKLNYPTDQAAATGKVWAPGHYLQTSDDVNRLGMLDSYRNLVKTNANWAGYYGHYWWHRMESTEGVYDFDIILDDLDKAEADGKMMWIMLNNRSFHGSLRGLYCPAYITSAGWTYTHTASGQNFAGPKLWVSGCGEAWLNFMTAAIDACEGHPALQGFLMEECQLSGAWLQAGYTYQAMNAFLLEQSRLGAEHCITSLFHNNMGWSNEPASDTAEHYRMTDTMVRIHRTGLSPNDLALSTYAATETNDYGKYLFQRYAGEAYHMPLVEWIAFFQPETPRQLLDYAVDDLGCQFIGWQPNNYTGMTFTINDVIAEVNRQSGRINTTRPTNAPA